LRVSGTRADPRFTGQGRRAVGLDRACACCPTPISDSRWRLRFELAIGEQALELVGSRRWRIRLLMSGRGATTTFERAPTMSAFRKRQSYSLQPRSGRKAVFAGAKRLRLASSAPFADRPTPTETAPVPAPAAPAVLASSLGLPQQCPPRATSGEGCGPLRSAQSSRARLSGRRW
jgi:hypothetical protein